MILVNNHCLRYYLHASVFWRSPPWLAKTKMFIQSVPGGKDNILGGHSIDHSKQKTLYEHVSSSERFPRYSHFSGLAWVPSIVLPSRPAAGGKVTILGGHSIGHSKQKTLSERVSYSERFPR
jgi:hypothetical protein